MAQAGLPDFTVNSAADVPDSNPGDGQCLNLAVSACTLRAAIQEANAMALGHVIRFDIAAIGGNTLTILGSPLPTLTTFVWINGRTATGYNNGAAHIGEAPPQIYLDGRFLGGTDADGLRVFGNVQVAIEAIGIINFPDNGIEILNNNADSHLDRLWIGIAADGSAAGNGGAGILLQSSSDVRVGRYFRELGDVAGLGNAISNNDEDGIRTEVGDGHIIGGNHIGTIPSGGTGNGNGRHGVYLAGPNTVVGDFRGANHLGNVINNNGGHGIYSQTGGHQIHANAVHNNEGAGLNLNGGNTVGRANGGGNHVSGNGAEGMRLGDLTAAGTQLHYNHVYNNHNHGIRVLNGANIAVNENIIYGNGGDGLRFEGDDGVIEDNVFGLNASTLAGNALNGLAIFGSDVSVIRNRVFASGDDGIDVFSGAGNIVGLNEIGTSYDGHEYGNGGAGIRVHAEASATHIEGNTIGNNEYGIVLEGAGTSVCGNVVGYAGSEPPAFDAGNELDGVVVFGDGNLLGALTAGVCEGNVVAANGVHGLRVQGDGNGIYGNQVGLPGAGNGAVGVVIRQGGAQNEVVGNFIEANGQDGINLFATAGIENQLRANDFDGNGQLPIDLGDDGVTPNDPGDVDGGPNRGQNTPAVTALVLTAPTLAQATYHIDSPGAAFPIQVDVYFGQFSPDGIEYLVSRTYHGPPGQGDTFAISLPAASGWLRFQATDNDGNSSELGPALPFGMILDDLIFADDFELPDGP